MLLWLRPERACALLKNTRNVNKMDILLIIGKKNFWFFLDSLIIFFYEN